MNLYNVMCGKLDFVSDAATPQDAAAEVFDKTREGEVILPEIRVVDILTGQVSNYDSTELMNELEWEDD